MDRLGIGWIGDPTRHSTTDPRHPLGYGAALPTVQAAAYSISPADRRGAVSATVFSTADIAHSVGAILFGAAIPLLGYAAAFSGLSRFVDAAFVLHLAVLRPRLER